MILENPVTELKKELGLLSSFSLGFADVGADIFLALGLIAAYAHGAMPLAILIASFVYICTGLAYAELASAIPLSGGAANYGRKAFGRLIGFTGGWGLILDYTLDIALFAVASAGYISFFIPGIRDYLSIVAALIIVGLIAVNLLGIKESSRVNSALTVVTIAVVLLLLFVGFFFAFKPEMFLSQFKPLEVDPGIGNFLYSITLAMVAFVGIESISQGAEETVNPKKTIPRATKMSIIAVVFFALATSIMSLGIIAPQALAGQMDSPVVALAGAMPWAAILMPIVALAGFLICLVSTNTGIIGVSRVAHSMSKSNLITRRLHWLHPKFCTPWLTIIIFSSIAVGLAYFCNMVLLGELYAFGALTAYLITNLSLIKLRIIEPELERPYKVPLNIRFKGRQIPLVSVAGAIGCCLVFGLVILLHGEGRTFAIIWFSAGIAYFLLKDLRAGRQAKAIALETRRKLQNPTN